jgi:hypothetical protein
MTVRGNAETRERKGMICRNEQRSVSKRHVNLAKPLESLVVCKDSNLGR